MTYLCGSWHSIKSKVYMCVVHKATRWPYNCWAHQHVGVLFNRRLSDVMELLSSKQPQCPQLYIYSSADRVIPAKSVEAFIEGQRKAGHEVRACDFVSSPHVDHYRSNPGLYTSQLVNFLEECVLAKRCEGACASWLYKTSSCFSLFVPGLELKCTRDTDIRGLHKKNPDLFFPVFFVLTVFVGWV